MADGTVNCGYCGLPIDIEDELAYRKTLPREIQSRLAHATIRDTQGRLNHESPWQCLRAYQRRKGLEPWLGLGGDLT